jgi:hypothetical protein
MSGSDAEVKDADAAVAKFQRDLRRSIFRAGFKLDPKRIPSNMSYRLFWNMLTGREEARHVWLVEAGWDTSWLFHNWHQLPAELKLDLCRIRPEHLSELVQKGSEMARRNL